MGSVWVGGSESPSATTNSISQGGLRRGSKGGPEGAPEDIWTAVDSAPGAWLYYPRRANYSVGDRPGHQLSTI
eukprot:28660-Pyramimonas_sp.AAC.1